MGRHKEQEGGINISVSMYAKHKKMTDELIEKGFYEKVSEIVRYGIEQIYNEQIGEFVNALTEPDYEQEQTKLSELIDSYNVRKSKMTVKGMSKYEYYSKQWLEGNVKLVGEVFPSKTIDEVYTELENIIKVN